MNFLADLDQLKEYPRPRYMYAFNIVRMIAVVGISYTSDITKFHKWLNAFDLSPLLIA